jgi:hypothetical protein
VALLAAVIGELDIPVPLSGGIAAIEDLIALTDIAAATAFARQRASRNSTWRHNTGSENAHAASGGATTHNARAFIRCSNPIRYTPQRSATRVKMDHRHIYSSALVNRPQRMRLALA